MFNLDTQKFLHEKISLLKFGFYFNQLIDNLPPELENLELDNEFNHLINNFSQKIKRIILGIVLK